MIGWEVIQFCKADNLGDGRWRLGGLLRGRGGTEPVATAGTPQGADFVLLDQKPLPMPAGEIGDSPAIAAIGLADSEPVIAPIIALGRSRKPLIPVHGRVEAREGAGLALSWRRRSRGSWTWDGLVDVPLNEQFERYEVGLGDPDNPSASWETGEPAFQLDAATRSQLAAEFADTPLWVRQIGTHNRSEALFLTTIS